MKAADLRSHHKGRDHADAWLGKKFLYQRIVPRCFDELVLNLVELLLNVGKPLELSLHDPTCVFAERRLVSKPFHPIFRPGIRIAAFQALLPQQ